MFRKLILATPILLLVMLSAALFYFALTYQDPQTKPNRPTLIPTPLATSAATCNDATYCSDMRSCAQAYACLDAGKSYLDADDDGVPCESICR